MAEILQETYGVMVYQEDVIKVAHHFGGVSLGEADVLRRAMSGKYRSRNHFDLLRDRYFANCAAMGYDQQLAAEVWRQMESFSGYSFCKAHSASFAVESYQSLFFKAHYPLEFMVGVINNFGGFYRTEVYIHEARVAGAAVHAPCVNQSVYLTSIQGTDLWLGLVHIIGLERGIGEVIVEERRSNGHFRDLVDFTRRIHVGLEQVMLLIRVGALRFTGKSKKKLLWEANMHFSKPVEKKQKSSLFGIEAKDWSLPDLPDDPIEDAYDEIELLGFSLPKTGLIHGRDVCAEAIASASRTSNLNSNSNPSQSPGLSPGSSSSPGVCPVTPPAFELLSRPLGEDEVFASDFDALSGQRVVISGYLITTKQVKTVKGDMMGFSDFIDARGEYFDATLFPDTFMKFPLTGIGVYRMVGIVADDFGVGSIEVEAIERLGYVGDPRRD